MSRVIAIASIWLLIACLRTDEFKSTWRQFEPGSLLVQTLGRFFDDCVGICRIIGSIWDHAFDSDEVVSSSRKDIRTESPGPHERKISELREILDELDNAEGMLDDAEVSLRQGMLSLTQWNYLAGELQDVLDSNQRLSRLSGGHSVSTDNLITLFEKFSENDQARWLPVIDSCRKGIRDRRKYARGLIERFRNDQAFTQRKSEDFFAHNQLKLTQTRIPS